jgi:hypothetical protein
LFEEIDRTVEPWRSVTFHLDGSDAFLDRADAELWVRESVDAGYPNVRFVIESSEAANTVVNLAAFEAPDSAYHA